MTTDAASPKWPETPAGIGLGLRAAFASRLLEERPEAVRWLEIHPENYIRRGGRFRSILEDACSTWPFTTHGLSLCFGSVDPADPGYVRELRRLTERVGAPWYSDHLCFGGVDNAHLHDLLPIPRDEGSIETVVRRIKELQDGLGIDVAVENVSYYADSAHDRMPEIDFVNEVLERADAKLLLDVNNVYVNSVNHGFDPAADYIDKLPMDRVVQFHIAGHFVRKDGLIIDTHAEPICDGVYDLFEHSLRLKGHVPVLLERDGNYPELQVLLEEVAKLEEIYVSVLGS
ncbi:MAG: hypothetical protein ACJAYU_003022 [Bradymonadia bacterium]|jgi:uncharacterized protein (UPF0276 family)